MEPLKENKLSSPNLTISIKSDFILKKIFYLLNEKKKLILINYNKKIQKRLQIDLEYFKKISGKEIIGDKNGKGKVYRDYRLIFQGFYLNRKRNGKGKEYYPNCNIKFIGEFLDNNKIKRIE